MIRRSSRLTLSLVSTWMGDRLRLQACKLSTSRMSATQVNSTQPEHPLWAVSKQALTPSVGQSLAEGHRNDGWSVSKAANQVPICTEKSGQGKRQTIARYRGEQDVSRYRSSGMNSSSGMKSLLLDFEVINSLSSSLCVSVCVCKIECQKD